MPRAKRKKLRRTQTLRALWLAAALAHPVPSLRCCLRGAEYPLSIPQAARLRTLPLSPASLGLRAGRGDTSARLHACAGLRDGGATHKRWVPPPLSPGLLLVRLSPPLQGAPDTRARPLMAAECLSPVLGLLVRRLVRKVNRPLPALLGVLGGVHVHLLHGTCYGRVKDATSILGVPGPVASNSRSAGQKRTIAEMSSIMPACECRRGGTGCRCGRAAPR